MRLKRNITREQQMVKVIRIEDFIYRTELTQGGGMEGHAGKSPWDTSRSKWTLVAGVILE